MEKWREGMISMPSRRPSKGLPRNHPSAGNNQYA